MYVGMNRDNYGLSGQQNSVQHVRGEETIYYVI